LSPGDRGGRGAGDAADPHMFPNLGLWPKSSRTTAIKRAGMTGSSK